tara:strand:- start:12246 stop:12602 length:357 start_codon:yes stop_codon:yes gene_type:complete
MEALALKFKVCETKIKETQKALKVLRDDQQEISAQLMQLMLNKNVKCIQLDEHTIVMKACKQYGSLNKEYLQQTLSTFCESNKNRKNDSKIFAEEAAEHLISNRDVNEKQVIKLVTKK